MLSRSPESKIESWEEVMLNLFRRATHDPCHEPILYTDSGGESATLAMTSVTRTVVQIDHNL
jgi:hypothetical protein